MAVAKDPGGNMSESREVREARGRQSGWLITMPDCGTVSHYNVAPASALFW